VKKGSPSPKISREIIKGRSLFVGTEVFFVI